MSMHINRGGGNHWRRDVGCPVCHIADALILVLVAGSPYYPPTYTCTCCGGSWSDGWIGERPFRRGWRLEEIAKASERWEVACECPIERDDHLCVIDCEHERTAAA